MNFKQKRTNRIVRHTRVRARIIGTKDRPRASVFRSNKHIFVQLIDDEAHKTILSSKIMAVSKSKAKGSKSVKATEIGKIVAEKAKTAGINQVIFDRGGYKYHGRVKALADGLRSGGIKF